MQVYEYGFVYVHVVDGVQRNHWSPGTEIRDDSELPVIGSGNGIWIPSVQWDSPESLSHLQLQRLKNINCFVLPCTWNSYFQTSSYLVLCMCDSPPLFLSVYIVNEIFLQLTMCCSSFFSIIDSILGEKWAVILVMIP